MTNNNPPVSGIEGHTPGPYHVGDKGGAGYTVRARSSGGHIVARVPNLADAHFLASAPTLKQQRDELLEALKIADCRTVFDDDVQEIITAAIRKAEGGEG